MSNATRKYNNPNKGKKRYKSNKKVTFIELGIACQIILDDWNISINVDGYKEFLLHYVDIDETTPSLLFEVSKDSLLWEQHFRSLKSILLYVIEEITAEYEHLKILKPRNARKHPLKEEMDLRSAELKILKLYLMSLEAQIELCGKIHFYSKEKYLKNIFKY